MILRLSCIPCLRYALMGCLFYFTAIFSFGQTESVYELLKVRSPLPTPDHINNLKYGNGKFLATVDRGGVVLSSDDGITWQTHNTGYSGQISDIAFGNGLYIATSGGSGPAFLSSDLETWTEISRSNLPSNNDNVYFHNGLFYFGGVQWDDNPGIFTTSDGVSFTELATPGEATVRDIFFANNLFIAVGDDLEIMTSTDGIAWTLRPTGLPIEGLGQGLLNVRYFNSLFIVGGKANTLLTSPDGIAWTQRSFTEDSSWFWDSHYANGTYYFPGRQRKLWTTTDFATWTSLELPGQSGDDVYNIVSEEGITVVTGRGGNLYSSTDLVNWTNRKTGYDTNFSGIAYGAGKFVASDFDGNLIKSTDGLNWFTAYTPGIEIQWDNFVFADGKFVAMSSQGEWILSADGDLWSVPTTKIDGFPGIRSLQFIESKWFIVGRDGFIRSSPGLPSDPNTWTSHDVATENDMQDIAYGNSTYVVVGRGGEIYRSSDGSNWTAATSNISTDLYHVAFGAGRFVATGSSSTVLTSEDGTSWTTENQVFPPFYAQSLLFRDGQFEALDTSGRVSVSSDGLSWKQYQAPVGSNLRGSAVSETVMVAVGNDGLIMSADLPPKKNLVVNIMGDEGTVEISPEGSPYPHLSEVTLTAVGTDNFAFQNWSGDASGNINPLVVTMDGDKTITANFVLALTGYSLWRYTQFTEADRADDDISGPGADPDEDGLTNNDEYQLGTLPKEFNAPKNLTVNIEGEGSVMISPAGGGPYTFMSQVTLTPTGTSEFDFTDWSGDASGNANPLVVTIDSDKTITANFALTLVGYSLWRYAQFSQEEYGNNGISGPQADFDKDGLNNLVEYLRGTNPKVFDFAKALEIETMEIGGQTYLLIHYIRDKSVSGIGQTVEVGSDLTAWMSGPSYSEVYNLEDNGDGTETVSVRILDPIGTQDSWFVRLLLDTEE